MLLRSDDHSHGGQADHRRSDADRGRGRGGVHLHGPDRAIARRAGPLVIQHRPDAYMSMLDTAETVARRYDVSREACDAYALQSQQRTAAAQAAGRFNDEIVPLASRMKGVDKQTGEVSWRDVTLQQDEGARA